MRNPGWLRIGVLALVCAGATAQSVQPVIVEYKGNADGKFAVINNSASPMVVMLEPHSFSIAPDGRGVFRDLDSEVHLQLSTTSVRLRPGETYYVFYKASAEVLPAWFTVYATFASEHHGAGLDLQILLPHTVYLYQRQPLEQGDVQVSDVVYSPHTGKVTFTVDNTGRRLARVQDVRATAAHGSSEVAGFPLLPGLERHVELDWHEKTVPEQIELEFEHFTIRRPLKIGSE